MRSCSFPSSLLEVIFCSLLVGVIVFLVVLLIVFLSRTRQINARLRERTSLVLALERAQAERDAAQAACEDLRRRLLAETRLRQESTA